jgi:hypothetical protein
VQFVHMYDISSLQYAVQISVLCRNAEQAAAAAEVEWLEEIILDFLTVQGLKAAVCQGAWQAGLCCTAPHYQARRAWHVSLPLVHAP